MYERGRGIEKSSDQAIACVGLRYDIHEDFDQAIECLKLASENNDRSSPQSRHQKHVV
jgi:prefoldin subunit 5